MLNMDLGDITYSTTTTKQKLKRKIFGIKWEDRNHLQTWTYKIYKIDASHPFHHRLHTPIFKAPSREFNWKVFNYVLSILFIELSLFI